MFMQKQVKGVNVSQKQDPHFDLRNSNKRSKTQGGNRKSAFIQNIPKEDQIMDLIIDQTQTNVNRMDSQLSQQKDNKHYMELHIKNMQLPGRKLRKDSQFDAKHLLRAYQCQKSQRAYKSPQKLQDYINNRTSQPTSHWTKVNVYDSQKALDTQIDCEKSLDTKRMSTRDRETPQGNYQVPPTSNIDLRKQQLSNEPPPQILARHKKLANLVDQTRARRIYEANQHRGANIGTPYKQGDLHRKSVESTNNQEFILEVEGKEVSQDIPNSALASLNQTEEQKNNGAKPTNADIDPKDLMNQTKKSGTLSFSVNVTQEQQKQARKQQISQLKLMSTANNSALQVDKLEPKETNTKQKYGLDGSSDDFASSLQCGQDEPQIIITQHSGDTIQQDILSGWTQNSLSLKQNKNLSSQDNKLSRQSIVLVVNSQNSEIQDAQINTVKNNNFDSKSEAETEEILSPTNHDSNLNQGGIQCDLSKAQPISPTYLFSNNLKIIATESYSKNPSVPLTEEQKSQLEVEQKLKEIMIRMNPEKKLIESQQFQFSCDSQPYGNVFDGQKRNNRSKSMAGSCIELPNSNLAPQRCSSQGTQNYQTQSYTSQNVDISQEALTQTYKMRGTNRAKLHSRAMHRTKLIQKAQELIASKDGGKRKQIQQTMAAVKDASICIPKVPQTTQQNRNRNYMPSRTDEVQLNRQYSNQSISFKEQQRYGSRASDKQSVETRQVQWVERQIAGIKRGQSFTGVTSAGYDLEHIQSSNLKPESQYRPDSKLRFDAQTPINQTRNPGLSYTQQGFSNAMSGYTDQFQYQSQRGTTPMAPPTQGGQTKLGESQNAYMQDNSAVNVPFDEANKKQFNILPLISYIASDVTSDFLNQMANKEKPDKKDSQQELKQVRKGSTDSQQAKFEDSSFNPVKLTQIQKMQQRAIHRRNYAPNSKTYQVSQNSLEKEFINITGKRKSQISPLKQLIMRPDDHQRGMPGMKPSKHKKGPKQNIAEMKKIVNEQVRDALEIQQSLADDEIIKEIGNNQDLLSQRSMKMKQLELNLPEWANGEGNASCFRSTFLLETSPRKSNQDTYRLSTHRRRANSQDTDDMLISDRVNIPLQSQSQMRETRQKLGMQSQQNSIQQTQRQEQNVLDQLKNARNCHDQAVNRVRGSYEPRRKVIFGVNASHNKIPELQNKNPIKLLTSGTKMHERSPSPLEKNEVQGIETQTKQITIKEFEQQLLSQASPGQPRMYNLQIEKIQHDQICSPMHSSPRNIDISHVDPNAIKIPTAKASPRATKNVSSLFNETPQIMNITENTVPSKEGKHSITPLGMTTQSLFQHLPIPAIYKKPGSPFVSQQTTPHELTMNTTRMLAFIGQTNIEELQLRREVGTTEGGGEDDCVNSVYLDDNQNNENPLDTFMIPIEEPPSAQRKKSVSILQQKYNPMNKPKVYTALNRKKRYGSKMSFDSK